MPIKTEDGLACIQQGVTEPVLGRSGKPVKCYHCGENHLLKDCPDIDDAKKKEISDEKRKHFQEKKNREAAEKAKKTVPGQAHMQTEVGEELQGDHQDEDDDLNFAFMQNEVEDSPMLKEQRARETLKPSYIYLDSTSSFCCEFNYDG